MKQIDYAAEDLAWAVGRERGAYRRIFAAGCPSRTNTQPTPDYPGEPSMFWISLRSLGLVRELLVIAESLRVGIASPGRPQSARWSDLRMQGRAHGHDLLLDVGVFQASTRLRQGNPPAI